jgi:hypothetical protein
MINKDNSAINDSAQHRKFNKIDIIFIILIVSAVVAVYCNTLFNGFVFDDNGQIIENRWIRDFSFIPVIFTKSVAGFSVGSAVSYYRPSCILSTFLLITSSGLIPGGIT